MTTPDNAASDESGRTVEHFDCDQADAEIDRLRGIIGRLYEQRGQQVSPLRQSIRRAFFDAFPEARS